MSTEKMFGYGKFRKYVSFPFDWLKPGEFSCDSAGYFTKRQKANMRIIAFIRRFIMLKQPIFWIRVKK